MGVAWDVTGNGKTAVRVNLGKYLDPARAGGTYSGPNPLSRISTTVTRTWTDANRDYVPNCDLLNPAAQDLRTSGGDFCAGISNVNFGKKVFSNTYDPALLTGWGKRPSDWSFGASVQREVLPRVSVEVGYYRRWWGNFVVTDNLAVAGIRFHAVQRRGARRSAAARRRRQHASPACTMSTRRSSDRRTTSSRWRATTGTSTRTSTPWT